MSKKLNSILIIFIVLISPFLIKQKPLMGGDNNMEWGDFGKWYEWKTKQDININQKQTSVNNKQRQTLDYLNYVNAVYEKAIGLWEKEYKTENISVINNSIKMIVTKKTPENCEKYKNSILTHLRLIRKYYELREEGFGEDTEQIKKINMQILKAESQPFAEFFCVLKSVGLFDNYENELKELRE